MPKAGTYDDSRLICDYWRTARLRTTRVLDRRGRFRVAMRDAGGAAEHGLETVALDGRTRSRGLLYMMASMRGIEVDPLYGLTEEEVAARSS